MPNKDFEDFKRYFKEYQKLFGLTGYKVYFKNEPSEKTFASISINQGEMVATVSLNSKLSAETKQFKHIKLSAKHEAIHLLLGRLEKNGRFRFASEDEIYEATEELVFKLEELIQQ